MKKILSSASIYMDNPIPVNEQGKVLTTDDIELMMNLIDLLFMGEEKDSIIPS